MTDSDVDELGPVDYVVVEFPAEQANFSGEMATELSSLIDRGVVRVLDLLILKRDNRERRSLRCSVELEWAGPACSAGGR